MPILKCNDARRTATDAVVLDLGDLQRHAQAVREQGKRDAQAVLEAARQEAARLVAGADAKGHAKGFQRGREEGIQAGKEIGREEAVREHARRVAEFEQLWTGALDAFAQQRDELFLDARRDVVELAVQIARGVIKHRVAEDAEIVLVQLREALAFVADTNSLVIAVAPSDKENVQAAAPALLREIDASAHASVVADERLGPGSCVLRTKKGTVDASVETQIERIVGAICGNHQSGDAIHQQNEQRGNPAP